MRTTLAIDDSVLSAAKARARALGLTLGQLTERALQRELAVTAARPEPPELPVFRGGTGLRPGIDPTSNRSFFEALDRDLPVDQLR